MKPVNALIALGLTAAVLGTDRSAVAGSDHDHDHAAPSAAGPALPRFAAVSETFELVGVLDGKQITLYLDRFADNAPVRGAQIELEIGGAKFSARAQGDDAYEVVLAQPPKPGVLPVTAAVTAGAEVDLLAGEFDLHEADHDHEHAHHRSRKEIAAWAAGGLAVLIALVIGARRLMAGRSLRVGGAA